MTLLAILLLLGGTLAAAAGLGGLDIPDLDAGDLPEAFEDPRGAGFVDGNDLLAGTDGADRLDGGAGGDWILGFDGPDALSGGTGGDVLIGGAGADRIDGGAGDDFVEAANILHEAALRDTSGPDNAIADVILAYDMTAGSDAGDTVALGPGDDTVVPGSDDTVTGGAGIDRFALGDWIEGGRPVEITDFDVAEDVISFVYDSDGATPEMTVEHDSRTGVTTIRADGQPIAVLRGTSPEFSVHNIAVGRYAA